MKKKIVLLALLALIAIPIGLQSAKAQNSIDCFVGTQNVFDIAPISLNSAVTCSASTTNPNVNTLQITTTPPSGPSTTNTFSGTSGSVSFVANQAGTWTVHATWFDKMGNVLGTEIIDIQVSFLVLPESPIGAIALAGTAFGGLGGFLALRHRKMN